MSQTVQLQEYWIKTNDFDQPNIAIMVDIVANIKYNSYCSE